MNETQKIIHNLKTYTMPYGSETLTLETGKLAPQANAAVIARLGESVVLATVVMNEEIKPGLGYFPLFVDYEERLYAAGRIKGSRFSKREGRPTDEAVVTSRVVDRSLRPNFPKGMLNEVQVIITVLSFDGIYDTDVLAIIAASAALSISSIPFGDSIGSCRIGMLDGKFILNPTFEQRKTSVLDLILSGTSEVINMIEAGAHQIPEEDFLKAAELGKETIASVANLILKMKTEIGHEKNTFAEPIENIAIKKDVSDRSREEISTILYAPEKQERSIALDAFKTEIVKELLAKYPDDTGAIKEAVRAIVPSQLLAFYHRVLSWGAAFFYRNPSHSCHCDGGRGLF